MINNSKGGGKGDKVMPIAVYMKKKIKDHNLIFCGAAGNGGDTSQKYNGACIMVTSCLLKDGKPSLAMSGKEKF